MSVPVLQPRELYGLRTGITGNAHHLTDDEILYPAGGVLVLHNYTQRRQRYLRLPDRMRELSCMCLSPSKKLLAAAERADKPVISVFDLPTLKRRKQLAAPPDATADSFQNMHFAHDNKILFAVLGHPDWTLICYVWEKGKIDSTVKVNNPSNPGPVLQVVPNPTDATVVCTVGPGLFRLFALSEAVWRNYGYNKSDIFPLTCVCWLGIDRLLAGTRDGRLLLVEFGELRGVFRAPDLPVLDLKGKDTEGPPVLATHSLTSLETTLQEDSSYEVREIISFSKGFVFACGTHVHLFEKLSNLKYIKRNVFKIPSLSEDETKFDEKKYAVKCLSVNPSMNSILAVTDMSQLFAVPLWGPDISEVPIINFQIVGEPLHQGPVVGLAVCAWKSVFLTCGKDNTLRVWNYATDHVELVKEYQEELCSVALHPTGLFALIGFSDKLRFVQILIDDIKVTREFTIRSCKECAFSSNGHMFAAINGTAIQVYSSISHELIYTLKGHSGKISGIIWSQSDNKLISCGSEGACYEWDMARGKRVGEIIIKTCQLTGVSVTSDGKTTYAIGSDSKVREISNSQITREVSILNDGLDAVVLSRSDLMLFISGNNGSILSVKFPLSEPAEYTEYNTNNRKVNKMCLTYDDLTLISCCDDGTICIWKLAFTEGKAVKMDKEFAYSTDILIAKDELEDKISAINDLKMRMQELEMEHSYQMRQMETTHDDKMKEVHDGFTKAVEELKEKNDQMEIEHTQEINNINSDIAKMKESHDNAVQSLEANFNSKLIVEYDKYANIEEKMNKLRQDFRKQIDDLADSKRRALKEMSNNYEQQLHEKNMQLDELHEEAIRRVKEHEEIKQQIEDDADREIIELKTQYERQLKEERDTNVRLRGETGVMKKKFISSQKEIEEFKHQIHTMQTEHQRFQQIIGNLERDISDLKKEIAERDGTIQEKEDRMYELKRKNQELEKFKFVLNYKIRELKNQLEPKDREIKEKKDQITEMETELEDLQKVNTSLDLQTQELSEKLSATHTELRIQEEDKRHLNSLLNQVRVELHNAAGMVQDPKKLKDTIKKLYHRYSLDPAFMNERQTDADMQNEFMRQREFLENTIKILKKQLHAQSFTKTGDSAKVMEENMILISEINELRRELKNANRKIADMQSILGISYKFLDPKDAQDRLAAATKTRDQIHKEYQERLKRLDIANRQLKDEIQRLVMKLSEEEQEDYRNEQQDKRYKKRSGSEDSD